MSYEYIVVVLYEFMYEATLKTGWEDKIIVPFYTFVKTLNFQTWTVKLVFVDVFQEKPYSKFEDVWMHFSVYGASFI